jgi:prepilin-type processing-associated H-X9-DG protein
VGEIAGRPEIYIGNKKGLNPSSGIAFGTQFVVDGWSWADINSGFSVDGSNIAGNQNRTNNAGVATVIGSCLMNCTNDSEIYSFHGHGSQFVFCDGSVRFLSKNIDGQSLIALLTRDFGDIPGE